MAKRAFNARLGEDLLARLDAECASRGISKTVAVEDALERWLDPEPLVTRHPGENRTAVVAKRAGLTTAGDLLRQRQERLNKQMGWTPKT